MESGARRPVRRLSMTSRCAKMRNKPCLNMHTRWRREGHAWHTGAGPEPAHGWSGTGGFPGCKPPPLGLGKISKAIGQDPNPQSIVAAVLGCWLCGKVRPDPTVGVGKTTAGVSGSRASGLGSTRRADGTPLSRITSQQRALCRKSEARRSGGSTAGRTHGGLRGRGRRVRRANRQSIPQVQFPVFQ